MKLLHRLLYWISGNLPGRIISGPDKEPYLERYHLLRLGSLTVYLHRFVASDPDRGIHDHPWRWAASLILAGGYEEERLVEEDGARRVVVRRIRPGNLNLIRGDDFHRVVLPEKKPVWSIFVHGRRVKGWGFLKVAQRHGVNEYRPHDADGEHRFKDWHKTAPKGRDLTRMPCDPEDVNATPVALERR